MPTSSEMSSKTIATTPQEKADSEGYFTYVEGVGNIPIDIYKHVKSDPLGDLPRYSVHIVMQHLLIFITFLFLVATGLPIFFSDVFWAPYVISFFGGIDLARLIHRIAAFTMMFASAYHLVTIVGGTIQKILNKQFDYKRTQIPRLKDLFDLIHDIQYFLGRRPYRPKMEKFMYKQKAHYLAIIWGSFVLMTAGSALLFPDITSKLVPETIGQVLPQGAVGEESSAVFFQALARLMHADEAVMALILIAFWHWINVHFVPGRFPIQWTFLTGKITREHQIEEHFLEYLNNLEEIPEEREYMRNLLKELGIESSQAVSASDQKASSPQPAEEETEKKHEH
jgi:cytochrome b subunit of formate dehydrogenase